jgi:hypothetical protein
MRIDGYAKTALTVVAIALSTIAAYFWTPRLAPSLVEAQVTTPKYDVAIPKAWGKLVGYSNNNLLLEAPDGTLRIVDVEGKPPEYPRVKVQVRWN